MKKRMLISMFLLAAGSCFAQAKAEGDGFRMVVGPSLFGLAEIKLVDGEPDADFFLERLDGSVTLEDAEDRGLEERNFVFLETADFSRIAREGPMTERTRLDMYCVTGDIDIINAFRLVTDDSSSGNGMDEAVMSQHQIMRFCEKNMGWMREKYGFVNFIRQDSVHYLIPKVFFLTKVDGKYFAVCVECRDDDLIAYSFRLQEGYYAGCFLMICPHIERNHGRG